MSRFAQVRQAVDSIPWSSALCWGLMLLTPPSPAFAIERLIRAGGGPCRRPSSSPPLHSARRR